MREGAMIPVLRIWRAVTSARRPAAPQAIQEPGVAASEAPAEPLPSATVAEEKTRPAPSFMDPSRYPALQAIGQLVPDGWTWTATSIACVRTGLERPDEYDETSALLSPSNVRMRFEESGARHGRRWSVVVDMGGVGETIRDLRVLRGPIGCEEDAGRQV